MTLLPKLKGISLKVGYQQVKKCLKFCQEIEAGRRLNQSICMPKNLTQYLQSRSKNIPSLFNFKNVDSANPLDHLTSLSIYINPRKCHTQPNCNRPISQRPPNISKSSLFLWLLISSPPVLMAKSSSSVPLIFILVLVLSISSLDARKLLSMEKKGGVSSMEESLILPSLPKGSTPPSSPSDKGYAMVNINGRLFSIHLPSIKDRMLGESVPSPGIGH